MTSPETPQSSDPSVEQLTRLNKELFGENVVVIDDTTSHAGKEVPPQLQEAV